MMPSNPRYKQSMNLWERSKQFVIPGSSTLSKRADLYPLGAYPIYIKEALDAKVVDIDGNHYVDFQSALGAVLLGFNQAHVQEAMFEQLKAGSLFSLSNPAAVQLAEKIIGHIPSADRVRILKNGSDATTAAVRIARAFTGREKILACHYHGWHDWYYVSTQHNAGIPKNLKEQIELFPYNNTEVFAQLLEKNKGKIAAVIMEPCHLHAPAEGYLEKLQKMTAEAGALLIFDEVVTGFRFGLAGAQSYFGINPDLSCFAKALGNGAPISLIAGKKEIMDASQEVVTTQTYGEDCLAIAAAIACLEVMEREAVLERIWKIGSLLQAGYKQLAQEYGIDSHCQGYPVRLQIEFANRGTFSANLLKSFLLQETAKDGFLIAPMIFVNYAHTEKDVANLLKSVERAFKKIVKAKNISLDGRMAINLW